MTKSLHREFTKPELLDICEELEIPAKPKITTVKLVAMVIDNLDEEGMPEDDDMSDLLFDFCDKAGYFEYEDEEDYEEDYEDDYDEEYEEYEEYEDEEEEEEESIDEEELPDCYTFADERDPACGRCAVYAACMAERQIIRKQELPCFGKLYNRTDENCAGCLEAGPCRLICEK